MTTEKSKAMSIGAMDYIAKPVKPEELRTRVRGALRCPKNSESVSFVDIPTGLWNRAYLELQVESMFSLAVRCGTALACIVIELEAPTRLLESFGEAFVSDLLRAMGRVLTGGCRTEDVVCRWDTWKFAILATNANRAAGTMIADRLVSQVQRQLAFRRGRETHLTCISGVTDSLAVDVGSLVEGADNALRAAAA
jgi:diguanylate cyclase (GGDEF)-like protein